MQTALGRRLARLQEALHGLPDLEDRLAAAARTLADCYRSGGQLLAAGNGGSAAEAQHLTAELLGRLSADRDRAPLAALALTADIATITAVANDYGYDEVFARQVTGLSRPGDVLVVLSTSGRSHNLVRAVAAASERGVRTIGLLGRGPSPLHEGCDDVLAVPAEDTATVQECHLLLLHSLVEMTEDLLTGTPPRP